MLKHTLIALSAGALLLGCHNKKPPESAPTTHGPAHGETPAVAAVNPPSAEELAAAADVMRQNFRRVHFEFDSAALTPTGREALTANAALLKKYPDIRVEVQGHCDERGSTDYNLALGQSRAKAVEGFLRDLGVPRGQVATVSFGEERPLANGSDDRSRAVNRRAEFRVTVGADEQVEGTLAQPADFDAL